MGVSIEADLYDYIRDNIRHWVGKNFGSQELEDPSWDINALARHLTTALNKRDRTVKNLTVFHLEMLIKEMPDEKRAKLTARIVEKLERLGGSMVSIKTSGVEDFNHPVKGETRGIRIKMDLEMVYDALHIRGFNRWLERQEEGHGDVLTFMLMNDNTSMSVF